MRTIYVTEEQVQKIKDMLTEPIYGSFTDIDYFVEISGNDTGLKYSIFVDDDLNYKKNSHTKCLYYNGLPVSISYFPQYLTKNKEVENDILIFIRENLETLVDLADRVIDINGFENTLKPLQRLFICENRKNVLVLSEMANLKGNVSGLPTTLWIDTGKTYLKGGHGPRIKFEYNGEKDRATMTISDNPQVIGNIRDSYLSQNDINQIASFVKVNKTLLLQTANNEIDYRNGFLPSFIKVDKNGEPIINKNNLNFTTIYSDNFGFDVVKNSEGKYSFSTNGNLITDKWFDTYTPFNRYGSLIYAYVKYNNVWYQLFPNGKLIFAGN